MINIVLLDKVLLWKPGHVKELCVCNSHSSYEIFLEKYYIKLQSIMRLHCAPKMKPQIYYKSLNVLRYFFSVRVKVHG